MDTFSVLIPCYNAADYLPRLWECLEAQSAKFDEIICYDDASTDNTVEVAKQLGAKVICGEKNQGPAYARNRLAEAATSNWIHFHDADDTLEASYLEKVKACVADDVDVIICNVDWRGADDNSLYVARRYKQAAFKDPIRYTIINPIGIISSTYRKDVFLSVSGFVESLKCWEDGDIHVRLAAAKARYKVIEEVLATSLRHTKGISRDGRLCAKCRLSILKRYAEEYGSEYYTMLAQEMEHTANELIRLGDRQGAHDAIQCCRSIGGNPPTTNNGLLKLLKQICPALWLLQGQYYLRRLKALKP